jgi:hypothetical protein
VTSGPCDSRYPLWVFMTHELTNQALMW